MKWLARMAGKEVKPRTPLPPKPYKDNVHNPLKMATDARYYDPKDISITNPDKPHWQDPRFESRERTPFFDFFGFNRDWGNTMFKLGFCIFGFAIFIEAKMFLNYQQTDGIEATGSGLAKPKFFTADDATEAELRAAGFSVVGTKELSGMSIKK